MSGYWNSPEASADAARGWLHTGDLGSMTSATPDARDRERQQ
jgi:long-subunit acyl-CoA synthetase (AMP-forming)